MADLKMANLSELLSLLNELRSKKKGQNIDNITELSLKTYNWDAQVTQDIIDQAEKEKVIKRCTVNNRISYRLVKDSVAIIDNSSSVLTQTEAGVYDHSSSDFIEFKAYVLNEISVLKELSMEKTCSCDQSFHQDKPSMKIDSPDAFAIKCLQDHIKSLERQLNDKQKIIDDLLYDRNRLPLKKNTVPLKKNTLETNLSHKNIVINDTSLGSKNSIIKSPRKNKKKVDNSVKKNVFIIGDSMLNGLNEKGFKSHTTSIKAHSGATSDDICHYIKPIITKSPDIIVLHCGTNDISRDIKTVDNLKNIDDYLKIHSPKTKLVISSIITRNDKTGMESKVKLMNDRIKKFTTKNKIDLVNHENIDESCLSQKKLHLNKKGNSYLANNLINYLNN